MATLTPSSSARTEHGSDLRSLARRGALSVGGAGVSALASLAVVVVVTRSLGKAEAGVFFSATSVFTILTTVTTLGTTTGLVYFVARSRTEGRPDAVRAHLWAGLVPVAAVAVVCSTVLVAAARPLAHVLFGAEQAGSGASALRVLAVLLPLAALHLAVAASTQGFHTMAPTVWVDKVGRPLAQVLLLLAVVASAGLPAAALAWSLPYALGLAAGAWWLRDLLRRDAADPTGPAEPKAVPAAGAAGAAGTREFWTYTAPRALAVCGQALLQRLDIVLVGVLLGAAPAAVYTAATRFVVLGQLGSQAVALAVQSRLGQLATQGDVVALGLVYRTATAWVVALTWPVHVLAAVFATDILDVFGSGYDAGRWVVVLLAGGMVVATGCGMVSMVLVMLGRTLDNLVNVGVAVVASVGLDVLLIPRFGLLGAGLAWALAMAVANLLPLLQVRLRFGLHPFGRTTVLAGALALACWGAVPLAVDAATTGRGAVVCALPLCALLYAAALARLFHVTPRGRGRHGIRVD